MKKDAVVGMSIKTLKQLIDSLDDNEADMLVGWILENLDDLGFTHSEMCLMNRPHSHSADCDCGGEEAQYKITRILRGEL